MDNPEYTEQQINEALEANAHRDITVRWDGCEPERGGTADFEVYLNGYDTNIVVWDHGNSFDIYERTSTSRFESVDDATGSDEVAAKLIEIIEEAISAGKLGDAV